MKNALKVCEQRNTHTVYFDNFFSSYQLLVNLNQMGFRATSTMRKERIMKFPLINVKDMKKKKRKRNMGHMILGFRGKSK